MSERASEAPSALTALTAPTALRGLTALPALTALRALCSAGGFGHPLPHSSKFTPESRERSAEISAIVHRPLSLFARRAQTPPLPIPTLPPYPSPPVRRPVAFLPSVSGCSPAHHHDDDDDDAAAAAWTDGWMDE
eukprot:GHVU01032766.1.p2 GENE.GHVU01032766.1~~GHVU01032766.1.p2  ORF type:complete len:135 (-),score=24.23 GHVU01032766.1:171-575(-)